MNGKRQDKQPSKKQAIERMQVAERKAVISELELERLNKNWGIKFDMVVKMFEAAIEQAGTIGEARSWYQAWSNDINQIDHNAPDAEQQMDALLERHGFEFSITPVAVSHQEMCGRSS